MLSRVQNRDLSLLLDGYANLLKSCEEDDSDIIGFQIALKDNAILQKFAPQIKLRFEAQFQSLIRLTISGCDLRTLQNFPFLPNLTHLDISENELQGTFYYLLKCEKIQFVFVSKNIVKEREQLEPFKARKFKTTVCFTFNPFYMTETARSLNKAEKDFKVKFVDENQMEKHFHYLDSSISSSSINLPRKKSENIMVSTQKPNQRPEPRLIDNFRIEDDSELQPDSEQILQHDEQSDFYW